ncbi:SDR family NAD(P)-dependent oxidoreductase [Pyruvatibacter sp. HU-CL02332]|uniref:SDR family NAD(P)-dependent oxidoreductase n=1 Tax=Pyruvatibacter sp. HU-CL02332 TaxID=3127650 RepID=UPI003365A1C9
MHTSETSVRRGHWKERTMDLSRKTVFITGIGSGIGEATARVFAGYGANVTGFDLNGESAQRVAAELLDAGHNAECTQGDVRSEASVAQAFDDAVGRFGQVDFAINNAGIEGALCSFSQTKTEDFDEVISVNLRGVFLCMKHQLAHMETSGSGVIVNIASIMGLIGSPQIVQYAAAKHGVVGMTKSAAAEYAAQGIRINAVCPGAVKTPLVQNVLDTTPEVLAPLIDNIPARRMAEPSEVGELCAWLCSDTAAYMNGAALPLDGAYVAV